ncbi:DUF6297 family protein [Geodermatophilus sp. SYSU D00815]
MRALTRRAAAARAETSLLTRLWEAVGNLASAAVVLAVAAGVLSWLRERVVAAAAPAGGAGLPAAAATAAAAVLALAGLVLVLARLGPVSATPAAAAWWLPLPADRRGLLRGDLARTTAAVVGAALLLALPVALTVPPDPAVGTVAVGLGWAASVAAAAVGAAALLQTRGRGGGPAAAAGAVAVLAAGAAAAWGTAGALGLDPPVVPEVLAPPSWTLGAVAPPSWTLGAVAAAAAVLLVAAARGLDRLDAGRLRAHGVTAQFAAASFLSLDTRDLGRALSGRPREPRAGRRFRWVRGPRTAVVAGDLTGLARGRWQLGQLAVAVCVPVLVARTEGLGAIPVAVWTACVLGWSLAAVAAGRAGREAQAAPELDRLLPLSAAEAVRARAVVPLVLGTLVCGCTGLLLGVGTGGLGAWTLFGLASAPVWAAAALRGAYRPELDWAGPVMATPVGPVPVGVGATLVQGVDVGLVGSLPLLLALLQGVPAPALVAGQLGWSLLLAAGALALLAHRADAPA